MAGIYLHIPFCRSRCIYCGFYSTTSLQRQQEYVDALCREMAQRSGEAPSVPPLGGRDKGIETVYLGGGTPSQLTPSQLHQLFDTLYNIYNVYDGAEVTIECNPDDVTPAFADVLQRLPVNRVSMGAQTFSDERLRFLRRRHSAAQVGEAVSLLRQAGIGNISVDLIYGFPGETLTEWHADINAALALGVEHLSAYALSYEEGTLLYRLMEHGRVEPLDEERQRRMYYDLKDRLAAAGYEHYEISNFARPGRRSRHNSSYWNHTPYLGLGAGAHSFDGHRRRQWNVSDLSAYINGITQGTPLVECEELDDQTAYNDLVMTALRTSDGLSLSLLTGAQRAYALQQAAPYLSCRWLTLADNHLLLTRNGLFVSDTILSALMMVGDD